MTITDKGIKTTVWHSSKRSWSTNLLYLYSELC